METLLFSSMTVVCLSENDGDFEIGKQFAAFSNY